MDPGEARGRGAGLALMVLAAAFVYWVTNVAQNDLPAALIVAAVLALIAGGLAAINQGVGAVSTIAFAAAIFLTLALATSLVESQAADDTARLAARKSATVIGLLIVLAVGGLLLYRPPDTWKLGSLTIVGTLGAILVSVLYGFLLYSMFLSAGTKDEVLWARYVALFTPVQGIALTAVGALIGVQAKQGEINGLRAQLNQEQ